MTSSPFSAVLRGRMILVERAAYVIEQGGGNAEVRDLRLQLIDFIGIIHRNPSIEAASQDLYDAAAAYAAHGSDGISSVAAASLDRGPPSPAGAPHPSENAVVITR